MPPEEFDEAKFTTECSNPFGCPIHVKQKKLQWNKDLKLRNFRFLCSSRYHKRLKFNGKCGPTFAHLVPEDQLEARLFSVIFMS